MLLSGYAASKEMVEMVGKIASDIRQRTTLKPGSFFWSALEQQLLPMLPSAIC